MNNLEHILTHATDEAARLIDHFKSGNFEELVEGLGGRWQVLEDLLQTILTSKYIANATGPDLRKIGADLGVTQTNENDDIYRVFVYAKIAENHSTGSREDIYNVLSLLGLTELRVYDQYPATITVNYIPNSVILDCACVRAILNASSLPIEIDMTAHTENPFGFEGDTTASGFGIGQIGGAA
jgi:hypothetical protein